MKTTQEKQQAAAKERDAGLNCAQSVLKQFVDPAHEEYATKICAGFGGGMKTGNVCGALTAGIMALGQNLASAAPSCNPLADEPARELTRRFLETMGHADCLDIIGYNVNIPEEREVAASKGIMAKQCKLAINTVIEIVDEMIAAKAAK